MASAAGAVGPGTGGEEILGPFVRDALGALCRAWHGECLLIRNKNMKNRNKPFGSSSTFPGMRLANALAQSAEMPSADCRMKPETLGRKMSFLSPPEDTRRVAS